MIIFLGFAPKLLLLVTLVAAEVANASSRVRCSRLSFLSGINQMLLNQTHHEQFYLDYLYYCSAEAPEQYACDCGASSMCYKQLDPWGRNIGRCGCCSYAMFVMLGFLLLLLFILFLLVLYGYLGARWLDNKWWCLGYPRPVIPVLARHGPHVSIPATEPLPYGLFRGFDTDDFVNDGERSDSEVANSQLRSNNHNNNNNNNNNATNSNNTNTNTNITGTRDVVQQWGELFRHEESMEQHLPQEQQQQPLSLERAELLEALEQGWDSILEHVRVEEQNDEANVTAVQHQRTQETGVVLPTDINDDNNTTNNNNDNNVNNNNNNNTNELSRRVSPEYSLRSTSVHVTDSMNSNKTVTNSPDVESEQQITLHQRQGARDSKSHGISVDKNNNNNNYNNDDKKSVKHEKSKDSKGMHNTSFVTIDASNTSSVAHNSTNP